MTVTIDSTVYTSGQTARFRYSSDLGGTPTFYLYRNGVLVGTTLLTEWVVSMGPGESVIVEILDSSADPVVVLEGRMTLGWDGDVANREYLVQEWVSSVWTNRQTVPEDGVGYYSWPSRWLEDGVVHEFRVVPVGTNGVVGTALEFSALMVRNPDPPDELVGVFDEVTGKVTIDVAA